MSVVFAGKTLTDPGDASKGLRSMGIKDGSKVMLLGTKVKETVPLCGNRGITHCWSLTSDL